MSRFIYVFTSMQTYIHWRTIVIIKDVLTDYPVLSMPLENTPKFFRNISSKSLFAFPSEFLYQFIKLLSPGLMPFLHLSLFLPSGSSLLCSSPSTGSHLPKLFFVCDPVLLKKCEIGVTGILSADGDVGRGKEGPCGGFWLILVSVRK